MFRGIIWIPLIMIPHKVFGYYIKNSVLNIMPCLEAYYFCSFETILWYSMIP
jgi:hypothetical protein